MTQSIKIGKKEVAIYAFTGKVVGSSKNMETKVSGGGGGGYSYRGTGGTAPVRITSTTIVHDQLFLVNKEGNETALQLQGFDLACRESNIVSACWAIVQGDQKGPYFAIVNHTTGSKFEKESVLKEAVYKCTRPIDIDNKALGCLTIIGLFALCAIIWWPLIFALIGYSIYYEFAVVRPALKELKNSIQYPQPELW